MKKSEANIEDLRNQTVSWGTHRPDDLIPKFMAVLKEYGKEAYDKYVSENPEVEDWKMLDDETKGWVVDELFDLLDGIAPEDCYFGAHPGDGADFGFWQVDESKRKDSKKSEAEGNKDIYILDLTRIDAKGDEEGLDDMQAAQDFYDEDEAIQAAKDLADSYKDDDDVVQVTVLWAQEKPNGDIVDDWFDIFTASSSDSATTAKYRETAGYAKTDGLDYYAKGGKSEAKKSEGLPPKKLGNRLYRSRADLINKMKTLDAVEITTPAQFNDIHSKQWLHTAGYAMDINGNLVGQTYFGDKDGKWYYATTKTFQGDYLPECKEEAKKGESMERCDSCGAIMTEYEYDRYGGLCKRCRERDESKKSESRPSYYDHPLIMAITYKGSTIYCGAEDGDMWSNDIEDAYVWDSFDTISTIAVENFVAVAKEALETRWISEDNVEYLPAPTDTVESKKSESLTLKQKELKNMARYGEATDITTISDAEAKELKKKGIETVGISRGAYGMNGALLRDNEGNKYVITARSSNLFYFV